jgi:hypothetical protein
MQESPLSSSPLPRESLSALSGILCVGSPLGHERPKEPRPPQGARTNGNSPARIRPRRLARELPPPLRTAAGLPARRVQRLSSSAFPLQRGSPGRRPGAGGSPQEPDQPGAAPDRTKGHGAGRSLGCRQTVPWRRGAGAFGGGKRGFRGGTMAGIIGGTMGRAMGRVSGCPPHCPRGRGCSGARGAPGGR